MSFIGRRTTAGVRVLAVLVFTLSFLPGCGEMKPKEDSTKAPPPPTPKQVAKKVEPKKPNVPAKMRTVEVTAAKAAKGDKLFAERCQTCHGEKGVGRIGIGPALNSKTFLAAAADEVLINTIKKGRAGTTMIPWGTSMSDADVESIVAAIRTWTKVDAAKLNEAPNTGDAKAGAKTFELICSGCHGRKGAGYMETANGTGIGRKAFLSEVSDGYLRYIVKHGKSGTKMRPFARDSKVGVADLKDEDIENVIAYLRGKAW